MLLEQMQFDHSQLKETIKGLAERVAAQDKIISEEKGPEKGRVALDPRPFDGVEKRATVKLDPSDDLTTEKVLVAEIARMEKEEETEVEK